MINKVTAFKRELVNVSQSNFSRLDGDEWLNYTIIDMFFCACVQETVPRVHCYSTRFLHHAQSTEYILGSD